MKKLKNESGRSMVEMLGVLAIIGVLSVIGVYGYRQAMVRLKTNEILQFAGIFYTQAMTADAGNCKNNPTLTDVGLNIPPMVSGAGLSGLQLGCPTTASGKGTVTLTWKTDADGDVKSALKGMNTGNMPYTLDGVS